MNRLYRQLNEMNSLLNGIHYTKWFRLIRGAATRWSLATRRARWVLIRLRIGFHSASIWLRFGFRFGFGKDIRRPSATYRFACTAFCLWLTPVEAYRVLELTECWSPALLKMLIVTYFQ